MYDPKSLICLIDDDNICNTVNKLLIKKRFDHEVEVCSFVYPEEGLDYLKRSFSEKKYNKVLILLDINMPVMNGWEFLEEFKNIDIKETDVNITILSSSLHKDDIEKAENDPLVSEFVTKPLNTTPLQKLHEWMN